MSSQTSEKTTNFADKQDTYAAALEGLFAGNPNDTEAYLSSILTPTFTIRDDNETLDFATFVKHMRWLRENVPKVTVDSVQFLRDGDQLAERHLGSTTMPDGTIQKSETYQFAQIAPDGRIAWIVEAVTRLK